MRCSASCASSIGAPNTSTPLPASTCSPRCREALLIVGVIAQVVTVSWTDAERSGQYDALKFKCPGCELDGTSGLHMLPVGGDPNGRPMWEFDGNCDAPTLSPSILTRAGRGAGEPDRICHSFIREGQIEFLSDCTHALAGQTVPLPDLDEWMVKG